jgi:hypothetical protein
MLVADDASLHEYGLYDIRRPLRLRCIDATSERSIDDNSGTLDLDLVQSVVDKWSCSRLTAE